MQGECQENDHLSGFNLLRTPNNVIVTSRGNGALENWHLYNKDIRESTSSLLDSTGATATAYLYDDFGETTATVGDDFDNEVCYTGQVYDRNTGLYYCNARFYEPENGRFVSQDTYRGEQMEPDTLHLYAYCANDPINCVDPSGHAAIVLKSYFAARWVGHMAVIVQDYNKQWRYFSWSAKGYNSPYTKRRKGKMKKIIPIVLSVLAIFVLINGIRLLIAEQTKKEIDVQIVNGATNIYESWEGNYVLFTKQNGITTTPFVFGERLYLYDIESDKVYLLKTLKGAFDAFMPGFSIQGKSVFYEEDSIKGDGTGEMKQFEIGENSCKNKIRTSWSYAVKDGFFYGIDPDNYDIFKMNLKTKKRVTLLQGNIDDYEFLRIKGNTLYAFNQKESYLLLKPLAMGEEKRITVSKDVPNCIAEINSEEFIVVWAVSGSVIRYNSTTGERTIITVLSNKDKTCYECETCEFRNEVLYCNDENINIVKINCNSGEISTLIKTADYLDKTFHVENVLRMTASYCSDYIAIEVLYTIPGTIIEKKIKSSY